MLNEATEEVKLLYAVQNDLKNVAGVLCVQIDPKSMHHAKSATR